MLSPLIVTCVGLLAQGFFSARSLVQWIMSERAGRVLSPSLFWIFSVVGSLLLALYGYLRQDFAVVAGQLVSYYIYLWNLRIKRVKIAAPFMALLMLVPVAALADVAGHWQQLYTDFFEQTDLPGWLIIFGTFGQFLFTARFVYQWLYSCRAGESELPPAFWWISLIGAAIIFTYGILRLDIVLILGQSFGLLVYARNIYIGLKHHE